MRKIHRCFRLFPGHVVACQPNILPISVITKQSGCGELEHRLSSQPPRWLYRLFALLCSLTSSFPLSPISHVHKPTLNFWRRRHSPQLLSQCSCMSHPVCGAGVRRDECKERHVGSGVVETRHCESTCGKLTAAFLHWFHDELFHTDELLSGEFTHGSSRYNRGLCTNMENTWPVSHVAALEMTVWHTST